jgi:hypothetical protein
LSTQPRPIKVAATAPSETTRADEIAIKTAQTGKVTAVVAVMSIFSKKKCNLRSPKSGNEKPSCQKAESANFPEEHSSRPRNLSPKTKKGQLPKKLASKSKKLELNSTNLKLKSKKTRSDCTKKHDSSVSSELKVRNKIIMVLLDSESSGDLLFMKKGSVSTFCCKAGCLSVVGHFQWHLHH